MNNLPTEILRFFSAKNAINHLTNSFVPKEVKDFLIEKDQTPNADEVISICRKFAQLGYLTHFGQSTPFVGDKYVCTKFDETLAEYGVYNFLVLGFLEIRQHFQKSVKPVIVKDINNEHDIGTCFIITGGIIVTAKHCIEKMNNITIYGDNGNAINIESIYVPIIDKIDLALIIPKSNPFQLIPHFLFQEGSVLEEVLTMGYPPIPGFDAVQVSDISRINTSIKSSVGSFVAKEESYLDSQEYILINARVKGGNSGGPIIGNQGDVLGMITQIPSDNKDNEKIDWLGYGIGLPSAFLKKAHDDIKGNLNIMKKMKFENNDKGFRTNL
jgi:serine protease Do